MNFLNFDLNSSTTFPNGDKTESSQFISFTNFSATLSRIFSIIMPILHTSCILSFINFIPSLGHFMLRILPLLPNSQWFFPSFSFCPQQNLTFIDSNSQHKLAGNLSRIYKFRIASLPAWFSNFNFQLCNFYHKNRSKIKWGNQSHIIQDLCNMLISMEF